MDLYCNKNKQGKQRKQTKKTKKTASPRQLHPKCTNILVVRWMPTKTRTGFSGEKGAFFQ